MKKQRIIPCLNNQVRQLRLTDRNNLTTKPAGHRGEGEGLMTLIDYPHQLKRKRRRQPPHMTGQDR